MHFHKKYLILPATHDQRHCKHLWEQGAQDTWKHRKLQLASIDRYLIAFEKFAIFTGDSGEVEK
jgi:hypothetical protein